jgi:prolyl-tRNA synthetase
MLYSKIFGKTQKETKKYEAKNQELLTKAGFIDQLASGIYTLLPLGKRVLTKIENIIRQEMEKIGAQEIEMPLLHPKILWEKTQRWDSVDVLFKTKSQYHQEYALAPTHEETVTPLVKKFLKSGKDLPIALYHITKKFRDEPRPKSGILRGREFGMKDLYSFHKDKDDLHQYYQKVIDAYLNVFHRCGLKEIKITEASGGSFTKKFSHEFNVLTNAGEVDLIYCNSCSFAQNEEVATKKQNDPCPKCQTPLKKGKAIEVGNIFDLETRFSQAFDLKFIDDDGQEKYVVMGCYGIGTTRLIGAIVEVYHDEKGIIWPEEVSPYQVHLVGLNLNERKIKERCYNYYQRLNKEGIEVLFDDRENVSSGEKLVDADLIGIPYRLVVSKKTKENVEVKKREETQSKIVSLEEAIKLFKK